MSNFKDDWNHIRENLGTGVSPSGYKRSIDVDGYILMADEVYQVLDIDHRGYEDVQKIKIKDENIYRPQRWFWVKDIKIITKEKDPEYFL